MQQPGKSAQFQQSSQTIVSLNPATGEIIGSFPAAGLNECQEAVSHGKKAGRNWQLTSLAERKRLIYRSREIILSEIDEIAALISKETGKPESEAIAMEIAPVLDLMRWAADSVEKILEPKRINIGLYSLLGRKSEIIYRPLGLVLIIPAWNYPFSIPLGEAAMALLAGNAIIIKPSELTPSVGQKIGDILHRGGFPTDVVQIIYGDGLTGSELVKAGPDKIMFTGSVATGKKILAASADKMTPAVLELGGKDAMIVFEDANLDLAAQAAVWGAFCNAGQSCSSVERLYVHKSIASEITDKIIKLTKHLKIGAGDDQTTSIGSMSSARQLKVVLDHLEQFEKSGAEIIQGGQKPNPEAELPHSTNESLFLEPAVIISAENKHLPMQEETFGPTLPIATFETEEEAIRLANDSEFGLTASIWTADRRRARKVAERIEAGTICINEVLYTHAIGQTPWGGVKSSGRGRTHGKEGFLELVQPIHLHTNWLPLLPDPWWMPYTPLARKVFTLFATKFASGSLLKTVSMLPDLLKRILEIRKVYSAAQKEGLNSSDKNT